MNPIAAIIGFTAAWVFAPVVGDAVLAAFARAWRKPLVREIEAPKLHDVVPLEQHPRFTPVTRRFFP